MVRTITIVTVGSLLFIFGCDSLNLQPEDELSRDAVFQNSELTTSFLEDVYRSIGFGFGNPMIAGGVDEAKNTHGHGDAPVRQSNMTSSSRGFWDLTGNESIEKYSWEEVYSRVRDLNYFIQNVEESEALSASRKETLIGEAYFLRAFFYHNLMRLYGGVPLVTDFLDLQSDMEEFQIPRGSFEETINFIVDDLNRAADRLDVEPRQQGAASKGAALALKSRVLLHAASDLFADGKSPFDMAEVKYTEGSQQQRWQRAKDAAQAVIDLGQYSLPQAESSEEYHDDLLREDNPEFIWARYFSSEGGEAHNHSQWVSPNGYNSWSGDTPTQQHVNAYEMADGSQFEWQGTDPVSADEPVDAENPYTDRDPRFKANILHNGADWRPHPGGLGELDPIGVIQTGWYEHPDRGGSTDPGIQGDLRPGLDTREGPVQTWNGTWTGYNLKKFVSRDVEPEQEQAYNPWPFLRYSEMLLNYAEASAELGDTQDALWALNKVRSRVGMPDVPADGGPDRTLIKRIRQEREVELAFEEHRYFDVRRWLIAPEVYSEGAKGVRIEGELDPDGELLVDHRYNYKYNVFEVDQRQWDDKSYFLPINQDELNRNSELVQNPGY